MDIVLGIPFLFFCLQSTRNAQEELKNITNIIPQSMSITDESLGKLQKREINCFRSRTQAGTEEGKRETGRTFLLYSSKFTIRDIHKLRHKLRGEEGVDEV